MKSSIRDKAEGTASQIKGAIKEKIGKATNKPHMQAEGNDEKNGGKIQKKIGDVKKVFGK